MLNKYCVPRNVNSLDKNLRRRIGIHHFHPGSDEGQKNHPDPVNPVQEKKSLAEKTLEDVLLHFGDTLNVARRRYRQFVKNGIDQGKRLELQGGGLVRSAGGNKAGLLGRKKEERDKGDERVLGSGDFVMNVIKEANELLDERAEFNLTLDELVSRVCSRFGIMFDELISKNRRRRLSQARAAVSYLAVDKLGYTGEDVARLLKVSGRNVSNCRERGKILLENKETISEYLYKFNM